MTSTKRNYFKWAVQLYKWKEKRLELQLRTKTANENITRTIATAEGWSDRDMLASQTYGRLHRSSIDAAEPIQNADFAHIKPIVDEEMTKMFESRARRTEEDTLKNLRNQVEKHYNWIKSSTPKDKIVPTLPQFRQLPVIKLIQSQQSPTSTDVVRDLKSGLLAGMLDEDLKKWVLAAREAFGAMLGYPKYKSASKTKLHPAQRVTARFRCKRCGKEGRKYAQDGCLDFVGVCNHVCHDSSMGKRAKDRWDPGFFEADVQVIGAIKRLLTLANLDEETTDSFSVASTVASRIQCLSCESRLMMDFQTMMCHAHRHDEMEIALLPRADATNSLAPTHTFSRGVCAKLMLPTGQAKTFRGMRNYGCRHCSAVASTSITGADAISDPAGASAVAANPPKANFSKPNTKKGKFLVKSDPGTRLFIFDGLVSHVKEKHGIERIGDEDIFCEVALTWKK
ncbi:hypothetical protein HWV62_13010 [Athelia sp. TMB]|nr:hypothetical protein HWV62_13010 [Athelia sp. TMB]